MEACLRLGIDPAGLAHRPLEAFLRRAPGHSPELAQIEFDHSERARQVNCF